MPHRGSKSIVLPADAGQAKPVGPSAAAQFECRQRDDPDGALRVTLIGELDMAVAGQFTARLRALARSGRRVRLDLSELRFVDCRGVDAIVTALAEARSAGRELEVDPRVSPSAARMIGFADLAPVLWPASADLVLTRRRIIGEGRRARPHGAP